MHFLEHEHLILLNQLISFSENFNTTKFFCALQNKKWLAISLTDDMNRAILLEPFSKFEILERNGLILFNTRKVKLTCYPPDPDIMVVQSTPLNVTPKAFEYRRAGNLQSSQNVYASEPNQNLSEAEETQNGLKQQQKILILTAIPHGLRLDREIRVIEEAIRRATKRDLFEICLRTAVRPQDIRRAIAEEKPGIVHFCGHGLEDGNLLLEDDGGNNKPVAPEALASLFKLHADYVKCILLNACYSEKPAEEISQHIDYVIGMNNPIQDKAAIEFARGFYDGLGYKILNNQDVFQRAFDEAMVAILIENISQGQLPILKKKL